MYIVSCTIDLRDVVFVMLSLPSKPDCSSGSNESLECGVPCFSETFSTWSALSCWHVHPTCLAAERNARGECASSRTRKLFLRFGLRVCAPGSLILDYFSQGKGASQRCCNLLRCMRAERSDHQPPRPSCRPASSALALDLVRPSSHLCRSERISAYTSRCSG